MDESVLRSVLNQIASCTNSNQLETVEIDIVGKQGIINKALQSLTSLPIEKRKKSGQTINVQKKQLIDAFKQKKQELLVDSEAHISIDVTLPGKSIPKGSLHPITIAIEEIAAIFGRIGFIQMSYPEVEWDYFAFDALNMPKTHPARDDFETTFLNGPSHKEYGKMILTPHTSSGQVREMWRLGKPPIRMINIAKCYRPNWDATHTPMFHQFEGLCVDTDITIAHLKGTLDYFVQEYFGAAAKSRLRPHHFQFTEPSFEVDCTCTVCKGTAVINGSKCKVCKSGWLELGGTGMIHPNVLREGKIDPKTYSGWAFGFGIERVIMMKYGIDDIRNYYSGDIRFLQQF